MLRTQQVIFLAVLLVAGATGAVLMASPDDYSRALDDLDDADGAARMAAVEYFAGLGSTRLSDLLDELAEDHGALTTAGLAESVRTIGIGTSDVADVALLLDSASPPTRCAAISILAAQAASARTHLEAVAKDTGELGMVRAAAAAALGRAGAQSRASLLALWRDEDAPCVARKAALKSLALISTDGVEDVKAVAASTDYDWATRSVAIRAMGDPLSPSSGALGHLLTSREIPVRAAVVEALQLHGEQQDLTLVAGRLTDAAADVRLAALLAVKLAGTAATNRQAVIGRMLDSDPRVQALAAELVGQTCSDIASTVRPSLVSLLASTSFHVRYHAAMALFAHGDGFGAATMRTDAGDRNPSIAAQATQAYRLITGQ